jgi:hypothetical protein
MLGRGDRQHGIAAYFGINGGRIAEISTGQTGSSVTPSVAEGLPPVGAPCGIALRDLIEEAIGDIDLYEKPND